uniref:Uncharacterized protein n=1 Tax=Plectus sambesii TaxID=2011161 RepID=A0A914XHM5_9BILA
MSGVDELAEARAEWLRDMPIDFFRTVKGASEHVANIYYEEFQRRRDLIKAKFEEAQACLKALKWEDELDEEMRWETMNDLMDKIDQTQEILHYHEHRRIPISHRLVLEAELLAEMNRSLSLVIASCAESPRLKGDKIAHERFVQEFCERIRYTDDVYYDVHIKFLKSYLDMPW